MQGILILMVIAFFTQSAFAFFQVRAYQKTLNEMRGKGLLGIGSRKVFMQKGDIVILSYDRVSGTIYDARRMLGVTIFQRFRVVEEWIGLTLAEIEEVAQIQDEKLNAKSKRKNREGSNARRYAALLQAVMAIQNHLKNEILDAQEKAEESAIEEVKGEE